MIIDYILSFARTLMSLAYRDTALPQCVCAENWNTNRGLHKLNLMFRSSSLTTTKFCLVKAMVFQVVVYERESWSIKKAECQRIDVFELRCWRRLLRVPWTARRSNQSCLKEISPKH